MSDIYRLLNSHQRLEVWKLPNDFIAVAFRDTEVKEGYFLKGEYGVGATFAQACSDYMEKISGKTIVYRDLDGKRGEAVVL